MVEETLLDKVIIAIMFIAFWVAAALMPDII
jgi:hypothetical protein